MSAVFFPPTTVSVITIRSRSARPMAGAMKSKRRLSDLSLSELNLLLDLRKSRPTRELVVCIHEELARREANSAIEQARGDHELREEVVEELVATGKARHVAENLCNTEAKLLAQARLVGVI